MHIVPKYSYIINFEPYVVYWGPPKWNTEQSWWVSPKVADSHQTLPIYGDIHHRTSPYMDLSTGRYKTRSRWGLNEYARVIFASMEANKLKNALKFLILEVTRLFEAIEHFTKLPNKIFLPLSNVARRLGEIDYLVLRNFAVEEGWVDINHMDFPVQDCCNG